jgi:hypothetical protein
VSRTEISQMHKSMELLNRTYLTYFNEAQCGNLSNNGSYKLRMSPSDPAIDSLYSFNLVV